MILGLMLFKEAEFHYNVMVGKKIQEITSEELELLKQGLRLKINIWHGGKDKQTEALLKKLEEEIL